MDARQEIHKIETLISERKRMFAHDPARARSRAFYELWERLCKPEPFPVDAEEIAVGGATLALPPHEGAEATCLWDEDAGCAAIRFHSRRWEKIYRIGTKEDGAPDWSAELRESAAAQDDAERIDAFRDLAAALRDASIPLEKMKLKEFRQTVPLLSGRYPEPLLAELEKLPLKRVREFFHAALRDAAEDELNDQMTLPLDGTYAQPGAQDDASFLKGATDAAPADTVWRVEQRLELLERSALLQAKHERNFQFPLDGAEALQSKGTEWTTRIYPPKEAPVRQDDLLIVTDKRDGQAVGTLKVDLFDEETLIGRLRAERTLDFDAEKPHWEASLRKGPVEQYFQLLRDMRNQLEANAPTPDFRAAGAILGLERVPFRFPGLLDEKTEPMLNRAQSAAFRAACDPENRLVLIQGPPGTGKTHLLERIVRAMSASGMRILVGTPSHAAIDNLCRRIMDLPFLRVAKNAENVDPALYADHWTGTTGNYRKIRARCGPNAAGLIFAGTLPGLLRDYTVENFLKSGTDFDALLIDEAGMATAAEAILAARLARRVVLLGDHRQLPPFPLPQEALRELVDRSAAKEGEVRTLATRSVLEWLIETRKCPSFMLNLSYRCKNPRLLRFASTMFYGAALLPNPESEYYRLPVALREAAYPPSTLRIVTTSALPFSLRRERLALKGGKPGICNPCEAELAADAAEDLLNRFPLEEIMVITPYRKQVSRLRSAFAQRFADRVSKERLERFLDANVSTVDSFQGGEREAVVISYVRSNRGTGIGFADNPNRINVAYTRCRSELVLIGDLDCLKAQCGSRLFLRLEAAVARDGEIVAAKEPERPQSEED